MFELEEMSSGFHDVLLNKYNDTTPIMDLYVSDSMQDMLDIDIKSEVATVVGGVNEFSSLMNFDLPSLELDSNSTDAEANGWCGGGPTKWSSGDIYADVGACVNPNSVMPVMVSAQSSLLKSPKQNVNLNATVAPINDPTLPSPKERKSHLTFSPNTIKVPMVIQHQKPTIVTGLTQIQRINGLDTVKKDLSTHMLKEDGGNKIIVRNHQVPVNGGGSSPGSGLGVGLGKGNTIKLAAGIGGLTFANGMQFKNLKNVQKITAINGISGGIKRDSSPARTTLQGQTQLISVNGGSPKVLNRSLIQLSNGQNGKPSMVQLANGNLVAVPKNAKPKPIDSGFPKPAYSYSCLIAMALKNSRSGSLPVSEIYSFMCEHFPYFKTAPNGWKNSVRHNLSLNKCFEKIEKPVTNGGQRKGCLWAMNPSKITKMDDEVQKWSRKDPMAIRKAMVHPEHLDALERGEMKHGSSGDSDEGEPDDEISDSDEVEEGEEVEDAEEEIEIEQEADSFIINTPESMEDPEGEEVSVDFDMEVPDFYDDINVDSKEGFTLEFVQKADLLTSTTTTLEDEDESVYITSSGTTTTTTTNHPIQTVIPAAQHQITYHQQQQQQHHVQPMAKRARLDVNYAIAPAAVNGGIAATTTTSSPTTFSHQISLGGGQQYAFTTTATSNGQQQQFQQIHQQQQQQQHHNRRKTPLVTRIA
ncbi:forkhead box protein A2-A isoform X2 [Culex pipiens pallens]|uniref:forkhead box protein A2-A isoform X2 n=1 Tax=Culex pipiens pallens TaxID=42434 RepID=UPI00195461C7|nr:forkhead box protein A2-A isoform X2 [Culex pipiens pallens]XP_039446294.1 forkhead box protein A2-A isoform X2 [Culex pipiens pallens]